MSSELPQHLTFRTKLHFSLLQAQSSLEKAAAPGVDFNKSSFRGEYAGKGCESQATAGRKKHFWFFLKNHLLHSRNAHVCSEMLGLNFTQK